MDFKLGWIGRLLLLALFGFGGCYTHLDVATGAPVMCDIHMNMHDDWRLAIAKYPMLEKGFIDNVTMHHGVLPLSAQQQRKRDGNVFDNVNTSVLAYYPQRLVRERIRCFGDDWAGRAIREAGYRLQFRLMPVREQQNALRQEQLGGHPALQYNSQGDLTRQLQAIRAAKFTAVREGME